MKSPVKTIKIIALLILAACTGAILMLPAGADSDYKYFDEAGDTITFPTMTEFFTAQNPGRMARFKDWHIPRIKSYFRKEGLENIRMINIIIPHPAKNMPHGYIKQIFLLDKDDQIVGYKTFDEFSTKYEYKARINGVINYVKIYIFCSQHGAWKVEARF